jgi:SPP1 family predicted phage head-tail adaptor
MNAGRNREVVTIQARTQEQDNFGQPIDVWTDFQKLRADVMKLSGREQFLAKSVGADITTRVMTRYCEGIEAAMRLLFRDEVLDIEAVVPDRRRTTLEILCKEVG